MFATSRKLKEAEKKTEELELALRQAEHIKKSLTVDMEHIKYNLVQATSNSIETWESIEEALNSFLEFKTNKKTYLAKLDKENATVLARKTAELEERYSHYTHTLTEKNFADMMELTKKIIDKKIEPASVSIVK